MRAQSQDNIDNSMQGNLMLPNNGTWKDRRPSQDLKLMTDQMASDLKLRVVSPPKKKQALSQAQLNRLFMI